LLRGEHWRWLTAHVVHLDLAHAALNVIGLALVWALYLRVWSRLEWLILPVAGMLAIDAGLWWWQPQVQWYVGASGVLHALLAAGLVGQWRGERGIALVVGTLLVAKLLWEWRNGALPFAGESGNVVLSSHRYGAAGGAITALALTLRRKWL
jgi:rhomboid family GlyGly-CTERM serine protease